MISRVDYRKKLQSSLSVKTKITYPSSTTSSTAAYRGKENIPPARLADSGLGSPVRARRAAAVSSLRRTSTGLGPASMTLYDMPL